jgi:hypothetical protein
MAGDLESIIASLVFPESFDKGDREELQKIIRYDPALLEFVIPVADFYLWLLSADHLIEETVESVIDGLQHYLHAQESAYALLVRMYLNELVLLLEDRPGLHALLAHANQYPSGIRVPPGRMH